MGDQNDEAILERFWKRMRKLVGIIPKRVINIMNLLELSGSDALATEIDWGASVERTVLTQGAGIYDEALQRNPATLSKDKIFGRHGADLSQFELTDGEKSLINRIARRVQERGILCFIHDTGDAAGEQIPPADDSRIVIPMPTLPAIRQSLLARLSTYYGTRPSCGIHMRDFDNLRVDILQQEPGKVTVNAQCVLKCGKGVKCTQTGSTWAVSNYIQHISRKHMPTDADPDSVAQRTRSRQGSTGDNDSDSTYEPDDDDQSSSELSGSPISIDEDELEHLNDTHDEGDVRGQANDHDEDGVRGQGNDHDEDADQLDGADNNMTNSGASGDIGQDKIQDTSPPASTAQAGGRGRKRGPNVSSMIERFSPAPSCSYQINPEN